MTPCPSSASHGVKGSCVVHQVPRNAGPTDEQRLLTFLAGCLVHARILPVSRLLERFAKGSLLHCKKAVSRNNFCQITHNNRQNELEDKRVSNCLGSRDE